MAVTRHPKKPNKWIIDYYPNGRAGKRVRKVIEGTEEIALEFERRYRQINVDKNKPAINPRVKDVLPEYLGWLELHRSRRYHEDMKKAFKQLNSFFGNIQLNKITLKLVNDYKRVRPRPKGIHDGKSGVCAINKELRYLRTFHSWAVEHGYATPLPFRTENLPYKPALQEIAHPSEVDKFLAQIKGKKKESTHIEAAKKKALIRFMYDCGLRWKEARAIRWELIDWQSDIVYLEDTKGGDPDLCLMTPQIRVLLEPLKKGAGWVFENPRTGLPWQSVKSLFRGASERAKIKRLRPHQLRRTSANLMMDATEDIRSVQEFLRHKSVNTTIIYLRRNKARVKKAMAKTADYIDRMKVDNSKKNKKN